ncbi:MAG: peptidoglycan DD-metalloendopeptidase family protein [Burkholderiaceae bacterium]
MSPAQILAKHLRQVGHDARRGLRVASAVWRRLPSTRRNRIQLGGVLALLPLSAAIAALAAAPVAVDLDNLPQQTITEAHELPPLEDQIARLAGRIDTFLREARIQRGDTLASLFSRLEIDDAEAARFIRSQPEAAPLQKFVPGRFVQAHVGQDGKLQSLKLFLGTELEAGQTKGSLLQLERVASAPQGFRLSERQFDYERRVEMRAGEIGSSLFGATDAAGVPDSIAQQMIEALENEIDFRRDLRRGDSFRAVYETLHAAGEYLRPGRLLAIEFVNAGKRTEVFWFGDGSRSGGYYSLEGSSMRRSFLRTPLEFSRISSAFNPRRVHPVTGKVRSHQGTDFAAPSGTRIRSASDGVVVRKAYDARGYGNHIEIRHDAQRTTLYGHMSAFAPNIKVGMRVGQGDVIGYVGSTGLSTGPHLHYEFKVNGGQVNPLTVKLPESKTLNATQVAQLRTNVGPLQERLALLTRVQLAQASAAAVAKGEAEPAIQTETE